MLARFPQLPSSSPTNRRSFFRMITCCWGRTCSLPSATLSLSGPPCGGGGEGVRPWPGLRGCPPHCTGPEPQEPIVRAPLGLLSRASLAGGAAPGGVPQGIVGGRWPRRLFSGSVYWPGLRRGWAGEGGSRKPGRPALDPTETNTHSLSYSRTGPPAFSHIHTRAYTRTRACTWRHKAPCAELHLGLSHTWAPGLGLLALAVHGQARPRLHTLSLPGRCLGASGACEPRTQRAGEGEHERGAAQVGEREGGREGEREEGRRLPQD